MRRSRFRFGGLVGAIALAFLLACAPGLAARCEAKLPTPEAVLGFRPGEDGRLAPWPVVVRYFESLAACSPRVRTEAVGLTTAGRPLLVVTITSEANHRRLEQIRRDNLRLADPRGLSREDERLLLASARVIVAMTFGVHANEVGGTLSAVMLAYSLAETDEPSLVRALDEVVLVLVPCQDPDGHDRVVEWARRQSGTRYEGSFPPELTHRYAGHDSNRDGYAFLLDETRLVVRHVHDRWRPQVHHDVHQMGADGPRMFLPPYLEPWEPNVDLALRDAGAELGRAVADSLRARGLRGIVTSALFDAWSPARAYVHTHGGVRVLSETAGTALAWPRFLALGSLRNGPGVDPRHASWNFPLVWPGGRWSLEDVLEYQLGVSRALLERVAAERRLWLQRFARVIRRAVGTREPFAFVVPSPARDALARVELLRVLLTGGLEVSEARQPFRVGGRTFRRGSLVVSMQQPSSAFARTILLSQRYPGLSEGAASSSPRPYDVTAHTLPLLLGVEVVALNAPFEAALEPVTSARAPRGLVRGEGDHCTFAHDWAGLVTASRLLAAGVEVHWALEQTGVSRGLRPPGTFFAASRGRPVLEAAASDLGTVAQCDTSLPRSTQLRRPRVGVYCSFVPTPDEGWTRFVFERLAELPFETIFDGDVRRGGLRSRFDALVLPDQTPEALFEGHPPGRLPPGFSGGLGSEGVRALRVFVAEGGTLVASGAASRFVISHFGLAARDVSSEGTPPVFGPGCILAARLRGKSPLLHGLPRTLAVWYDQGPVFDGTGVVPLATYEAPDPLLSGGLLGQERLAGRTALAVASVGRGRVVLFGFRPLYRGQSRGTMPLLLNALLLAAADPPTEGWTRGER